MRASPFRGRAAGVRTGLFIKRYLETHGEAYQAEIHRALKGHIRETSPKRRQLPTYESFGKYFRRLRDLGLLVFTGREEPIEEELLSIRKLNSEAEAVRSVKRYYALTGQGAAEVSLWEDPWKEYR